MVKDKTDFEQLAFKDWIKLLDKYSSYPDKYKAENLVWYQRENMLYIGSIVANKCYYLSLYLPGINKSKMIQRLEENFDNKLNL